LAFQLHFVKLTLRFPVHSWDPRPQPMPMTGVSWKP